MLCVLFGVPLALVLARTRAPRRRIVRPLILLPLVLPPVVGGIALLYAFGRLGLVGRYLEAAGIQVAFTTVAVVLAQTFVSLPFPVITLEGAARTAGADFEVVAATLGASPTTVWWRVTLPLLGPGLISGAVLAFARSLGEFGATLTFAGSRQGVTRTLPLEIYLQRESDADAAVALSVLLGVVAAVVVIGLGGRRLKAGALGMTLQVRAVVENRDLEVDFAVPAGGGVGCAGPERRRQVDHPAFDRGIGRPGRRAHPGGGPGAERRGNRCARADA